MTPTRLTLSGVLPPIVTPFKANGDVDEDAFAFNIERWNSTPLSGYLVLGSNSEAVYLTFEEKIRLVEIAVKLRSPDKHIMVGTGMESARETIRLTNAAAKAGAESALIVTPFYYADKMNDKAQIAFFREVSDASDIPILIYQVPKFTHRTLGASTVKTLSEHPNLVGMKDSSGNIPGLAGLVRILDPSFNLFVGTASGWLPALQLGIRGGIHALANCCPVECVDIQRLFDAGKMDEAKALYLRMLPVNEAVTATYGVAGLKYSCDLLGYKGGHVRSPLQPLSTDEKQAMEAVLKQASLL